MWAILCVHITLMQLLMPSKGILAGERPATLLTDIRLRSGVCIVSSGQPTESFGIGEIIKGIIGIIMTRIELCTKSGMEVSTYGTAHVSKPVLDLFLPLGIDSGSCPSNSWGRGDTYSKMFGLGKSFLTHTTHQFLYPCRRRRYRHDLH
jgi:hypothetical protein